MSQSQMTQSVTGKSNLHFENTQAINTQFHCLGTVVSHVMCAGNSQELLAQRTCIAHSTVVR